MRAFGLVVIALVSMASLAFAQDSTGEAASVPLEMQVTHPNGTIVQLSAIQAGLSETVVTAQIINGFKNDIAIAKRPRDSFLRAADGTQLFISPPIDNDQFRIPAKMKVEGELVFIGRLPRTESVVLILNDEAGNDSEFSGTPRFEITIPLDEAAFSEDGLKKN